MKNLYFVPVKDDNGTFVKPIFAKNKGDIKNVIERINKRLKNKLTIVGTTKDAVITDI